MAQPLGFHCRDKLAALRANDQPSSFTFAKGTSLQGPLRGTGRTKQDKALGVVTPFLHLSMALGGFAPHRPQVPWLEKGEGWSKELRGFSWLRGPQLPRKPQRPIAFRGC